MTELPAGNRDSVENSTDRSLGDLLRDRAWRRWTTASFLARLPLSMALLGLVLAGQYVTGSTATGAKLAGLTTFTAGLTGPLRGRLLDRRELRSGLQRCCFASGAVLSGLTVATAMRAPIEVLYALCLAEGWAIAGIWGGFRALLVAAVQPGWLRRAHFVESLMIEVSYGVGPVLVSLLAFMGGAVAAVAGMAVLSFAAALALRGVVMFEPQPIVHQRILASRPDLRLLCTLSFVLGLGFGLVENNVPQRMHQYGLSAGSAGLFLACLATGSIIGGLYVSLRPPRRSRSAHRAAALFALFAVLIAPSALASTATAFALLLLVASLMLVPLNGLGSAELEARMGREQRAEAFAYYLAATMVGGGIGSTLNGVLIARIGAQHIPLITVGMFAVLSVVLLLVAPRLERAGTPTTTSLPAPRPADAPQRSPQELP